MRSKHEKIFGLERNIFFTGLTSFFTDTSTKMIYSVMPLFLKLIGASTMTISLIEGIAESTAALVKVVSGYWSDKIRKNKPFMLIGYGLTALITPLYAYVGKPVQVLCYRFIERIGKGLRAAPRDSLISGSMTQQETGRNFGFHKAMDNSGAILGPLLAFLLLFLLPGDTKEAIVRNYQIIFLVAAIPAVLGVIAIAVFIKEAKAEKKQDAPQVSFRRLPKRFFFFLAIIFVFTLGNFSDALLLLKTSETGISDVYIPFVYMIFSVVSVLLAIPIGKWSDKIGRARLIIPGFLIFSLTFFMFGRFNHISIFIGLFVMYGLYSALVDGSQKAMIADLISKDLRGTGYGIYHAVLGVTLLPASLIAGWLYDHISSGVPFYFGSATALLAAVLMVIFVFTGRKINQHN